jgi:serine/threonine-protein kinase RsbT
MDTLKREVRSIQSEPDIVMVRQAARVLAIECGFKVVDQTKMVTAASELARNALGYGGGGTATFELISDKGRRGLRVIFEDKGPGISDVPQALTDGFTSGKGMGLGLGGARRLVNEFDIRSEIGKGTCVTITRWK